MYQFTPSSRIEFHTEWVNSELYIPCKNELQTCSNNNNNNNIVATDQ